MFAEDTKMKKFKLTFQRNFLSAIAISLMTAVTPQAIAQNTKWPNKPIRIVVAFTPGGLTDAYARLFAEQITSQLGVPAYVENKPGGGSIIGIDAVAKSPPDGYTLLMTTSGTVWQNRVLYKKLPYDLDKDLTPIAFFPSGPLVVGISEKVPVTNFQDFIKFAKNNSTAFGSYAPGSYPQMMADQINRNYGSNILTAHYKGESPMWIDLASNQVQVAVGSYQGFNTVASRGVRAIGVTGGYRSPKLPQVPTLVEQGMKDPLFGLEGGFPVMAPAGTPESVIKLLSSVVVNGSNTESAAKFREMYSIPNKPKNLTETRRDWDRDVPIWIKLAVDLGIKLD